MEVTSMLSVSPDVLVDPTAIIGVVGRTGAGGVAIGEGSVIRSHTIIYAGVHAGKRLNTGHGSLIRENNQLGDDVSIGTNATLEPGNTIGNRTRIHSGCFLENVTVGMDVFIGPNVVFTDDPHPPCSACTEYVKGAVVEDGAAIGGNVTILPGIRIGAGALVGAGSVVTKDVPPGMVVAGNPARVIKPVSDVVCRAVAAGVAVK